MRIYDTRSLGILIRDRRTSLGWSQQQLAQKIGVSRFWVMHLERGKPTLEFALVLKAVQSLGLALGISPAHPAVGKVLSKSAVAVAGGDRPLTEGSASAAIDLAKVVSARPTQRTSLRSAQSSSQASSKKSKRP